MVPSGSHRVLAGALVAAMRCVQWAIWTFASAGLAKEGRKRIFLSAPGGSAYPHYSRLSKNRALAIFVRSNDFSRFHTVSSD
jgi:hypothetical protein